MSAGGADRIKVTPTHKQLNYTYIYVLCPAVDWTARRANFEKVTIHFLWSLNLQSLKAVFNIFFK